MDQATADKGDFEVGDKVLVAGREAARPYELVGIGKIGDQGSLGIGSITMPLSEVQKIAQKPGELTEIVVAADGGTTPEELKARISQALGDAAVVRTGKEQAEETAGDINESLGFLTIALLVFAGDRRTRRRLPDLQHVRRHRGAALEGVRAAAHARRLAPPGAESVVAETLVIGFFASVVGIVGGLLLAPGPAQPAGLVRARAARRPAP